MSEGFRMTKRVQEILSYYSGDVPGIRANLARLLMSGRSVSYTHLTLPTKA